MADEFVQLKREDADKIAYYLMEFAGEIGNKPMVNIATGTVSTSFNNVQKLCELLGVETFQGNVELKSGKKWVTEYMIGRKDHYEAHLKHVAEEKAREAKEAEEKKAKPKKAKKK